VELREKGVTVRVRVVSDPDDSYLELSGDAEAELGEEFPGLRVKIVENWTSHCGDLRGVRCITSQLWHYAKAAEEGANWVLKIDSDMAWLRNDTYWANVAVGDSVFVGQRWGSFPVKGVPMPWCLGGAYFLDARWLRKIMGGDEMSVSEIERLLREHDLAMDMQLSCEARAWPEDQTISTLVRRLAGLNGVHAYFEDDRCGFTCAHRDNPSLKADLDRVDFVEFGKYTTVEEGAEWMSRETMRLSSGHGRLATAMPCSCPGCAALRGVSADDLICLLEKRGYGWSLGHTGRMIEARIWDWPNIIGRYRPNSVEPLADMLRGAMRTCTLECTGQTEREAQDAARRP
jgi:hypothetical protein